MQHEILNKITCTGEEENMVKEEKNPNTSVLIDDIGKIQVDSNMSKMDYWLIFYNTVRYAQYKRSQNTYYSLEWKGPTIRNMDKIFAKLKADEGKVRGKCIWYICHTFTMRRWGIRNSLISLPLASISSNKVWWSLSPGTLVLLASSIGLMATQATEFNKNKVQIAGRHQSILISELNTYF